MIVLLAAAIVSCQKDPSTSDLHKDYLVYTDYDGGTNFSSFGTYYIPDSILLIGGADKTEYWKNTQALGIVGKVAPPYWWWYYPYYWTPGYWGDWLGWHYPYRVYYGYTAGSLLVEMLNLEADSESGKKLPVVWDSFIGGLLSSNAEINQQRTVEAIDQAFAQSPYLKK